MSDVADLVFSLVPRLAERAQLTSGYAMIVCPFHGGGQEHTPSCSVRRDAPVFFCHACGSGGHISKLLVHSGLSKTAIQGVLDRIRIDPSVTKRRNSNVRTVYGKNPYRGTIILDDLDTLTPYSLDKPQELLRSGFSEETLSFFDVGWDPINLRITYPIRNIYGELIGISGRTLLKDVEPRYKLYRRELIDRKDLGLPETYSVNESKKATMWNFHTVHNAILSAEAHQPLVLVEGFKACMWVWQCGYKTTSALIGAYFSELQAELLARLGIPVVLFLDNNEAGWKGMEKASRLLHRFGISFRLAAYPDERQQPDHLEPEELQDSLRDSVPYIHWRKHHEQFSTQAS